VDELREAIIDGRLPAGAPIRQNQVIDDFGASAAPVREALQQLTAEGLLVQYTNRGTFVADFDLDELVHVLLPIRLRLEQYAAHTARETAPESLWADLQTEVDRLYAAADDNDVRGVTAADVAFHRTIVTASHSAYAEQVWKGAESRVRMQFQRLGRPEQRLHAIADEHRELLETLHHGSRSQIDAALKDHIVTAAEQLIKG
jgi:DNA-binding GntR family transcriptional regulator